MTGLMIRPYQSNDHDAVRALFIAVNRDMAPPEMKDGFERYIALSLAEELDRIEDYYAEHDGCFMVVTLDGAFVGNYGLERGGPDAMELRRMYIAPERRRTGLSRIMLRHAEDLARARGARKLVLSTSELQPAALGLYRSSGFTEVHEEIAGAASNKTVGGALRRFHFEKSLA